jgi:hypothetical protein
MLYDPVVTSNPSTIRTFDHGPIMAFCSRTITLSRLASLGLVLLLIAGLAGCQSADESAGDTAPTDAPDRESVETPAARADGPPDTLRTSVVRAVRGIDQMRSQLATTFDPGNVTKETFKQVCKPVGMRAKSVARDSGWVVQQLAEKYRNPAHQLDSLAAIAHTMFDENPGADAMWRQTSMNGASGWRYFQRITVEPSCLACHGPKEERPDFVKAGYPDDRAYGFDPGDLRGIYSVFVPVPVPDTTSDVERAPTAGISLMRPYQMRP